MHHHSWGEVPHSEYHRDTRSISLRWVQYQGEPRRVFSSIEVTLVNLPVTTRIGYRRHQVTYCYVIRTFMNVTNIKNDDILNHHLIQGGEGFRIMNKALRIINLNLTHLFYIETSVCNYNGLAKYMKH